ncbi:response regulator [Paenibacillaceae bacterium]|nr:response regulator [Paenibacillaceae bacterium]
MAPNPCRQRLYAGSHYFWRNAVERTQLNYHRNRHVEQWHQTARIASWSWDTDRRILCPSAQLNELLGTVSGSRPPRLTTLLRLLKRSDRLHFIRKVKHAFLEGKAVFEFEVVVHDRSAQLYGEIHCTRGGEREEGSPEVFGFIQDITVYKEREQALEEALHTRDAFWAQLYHEVRTPVQAINGLHHLLANTNLSDQQQLYVQQLQASSQFMLSVVDQVLDFSKLQAGKMELVKAEFQFDAMLSQALDVVSHAALEKQINIQVEHSPDIPQSLVGDSFRLSQVLVNLLHNAIKFSGPSSKISVRTGLAPAGRSNGEHTLQISVADQGIGLSLEQQLRIFQPFAQAAASTSRLAGGSGLGLVICKQLVEQMQGVLEVQSEPGSGSIFTFTAVLGAARQTEAIHNIPGSSPYRVLVIDQSNVRQQLISETLQQPQYEVTAIASVSELIAGLNSKAIINTLPYSNDSKVIYDIVIMDWDTDKSNNHAFSEVFRNSSIACCMTFITMIDCLHRDDLTKCDFLYRSDYILEKPLRSSILLEAIHEVLLIEPSNVKRSGEYKRHTPPISLENIAILLVEDNELNRLVIEEILTAHLAQVVSVSDGFEAINIVMDPSLATQSIVIMDLQLPGISGLETAARMRAQGVTVPIIAYSASDSQSEQEQCLAAGMNDYLSKAVEPEQLLLKITNWVKKGGE